MAKNNARMHAIEDRLSMLENHLFEYGEKLKMMNEMIYLIRQNMDNMTSLIHMNGMSGLSGPNKSGGSMIGLPVRTGHESMNNINNMTLGTSDELQSQGGISTAHDGSLNVNTLSLQKAGRSENRTSYMRRVM
jgi:hypothetical protein